MYALKVQHASWRPRNENQKDSLLTTKQDAVKHFHGRIWKDLADCRNNSPGLLILGPRLLDQRIKPQALPPSQAFWANSDSSQIAHFHLRFHELLLCLFEQTVPTTLEFQGSPIAEYDLGLPFRSHLSDMKKYGWEF